MQAKTPWSPMPQAACSMAVRVMTCSNPALYLAEIKGPVMDRLQHAGIAAHFEGRVFRSAQDVWHRLDQGGVSDGYVI